MADSTAEVVAVDVMSTADDASGEITDGVAIPSVQDTSSTPSTPLSPTPSSTSQLSDTAAVVPQQQQQEQQPAQSSSIFGKLRGRLMSGNPAERQAQAQTHKEQEARRTLLASESLRATHQRERDNLWNMCKIGVKTLIESSIGLPQPLTEQHFPLDQLLVLLESLLSHGLKPRRLVGKTTFWALFDVFEKHVPSCADVIRRVRSDATFKTTVGQARACLRILLMEHKLPLFLRECFENEGVVAEVYAPHAFAMSESAIVLSGILMGLGVIEYDLCTSSEVLDTLCNTIDMSLYLKDGNYLKKAVSDEEQEAKRFSEETFNSMSDQNATLREMNKRYAAQLERALATAEELEESSSEMQARVQALEDELATLKQSKAEADRLAAEARQAYESKVATIEADIDVERSTYHQSREGLNQMFDAMKKQLETEQALREQVEQDTVALKETRQEMEDEIEGLKKAAAEKEETIEGLRKQLKEVKALNLSMVSKLQELQDKVRDEKERVHTAEQDKAQLQAEIQSLQFKLTDVKGATDRLQDALGELNKRLQDSDGKRTEMETNLMMETQWRSSLQKENQELKERIEEMELLRQQLTSSQKELTTLQAKYSVLQTSHREQEQALLELGEQLSEKALKVDAFESQKKREKGKQWADDAQVQTCKQCTKQFGVKRRKHHCRNCGNIFCDDCSDNRMPLPSSAKVCWTLSSLFCFVFVPSYSLLMRLHKLYAARLTLL
eukprot:m.33719 g.33719  ORF g.33719 m.33719 type:complete len:729 (+) comp9657_c0_seq1:223-2409(+)